MNNAIRVCIVLVIALSFSSPSVAEDILSFFSTIYIDKDGLVSVTENIEYDFKGARRHGIFRNIPYKYNFGINNYNLRMRVLGVTDLSDRGYKYEVSRRGRYLDIKIGDPDRTITGRHTYKIEYLVQRAIKFYEKHDELYWNVTGTEWRVPMRSSGARVYIDADIPDGVRTKCFTGYYGSASSDCTMRINPSSIEFYTTGELGAGQGLTIVVGLPKGLIKPESALKNFIWFISDNWHWSLPFITFLAMFYTWQYKGKDPDTGGGNRSPVRASGRTQPC